MYILGRWSFWTGQQRWHRSKLGANYNIHIYIRICAYRYMHIDRYRCMDMAILGHLSS